MLSPEEGPADALPGDAWPDAVLAYRQFHLAFGGTLGEEEISTGIPHSEDARGLGQGRSWLPAAVMAIALTYGPVDNCLVPAAAGSILALFCAAAGRTRSHSGSGGVRSAGARSCSGEVNQEKLEVELL